MDDVVFNGTSYKNTSNLVGIVDTGTSVIVGPKATVNNMTAGFGNATEKQVDCTEIDTFPTLTFTIGGDAYDLKPVDYILQIAEGSKTVCIVGILGLDFPDSFGEAFILGDSFIKAYYTHFDVENERVGFAKSI